MKYSLVQAALEAPAVEKLQRAFKCVSFLAPMDAWAVANDAFGILLNHLEENDAARLQGALRAEGIETEIVSENDLGALPQGKQLRQVSITPEALMLFDPLGRSFPLEWRHILAIAAGQVRIVQVQTTYRDDPTSGGSDPFMVRREYHDESREHFLVEILLRRAALRYTIDADRQVLKRSLGENAGQSPVEGFAALVRSLCHHAPGAGQNRGVWGLLQEPPQVVQYPTRNAFYEEILWMLWQIRKTQARA